MVAYENMGVKVRSGESNRLPPMLPRFKSRCRHRMWFEFVVGSLLCSERFFSGYSGFPLCSKTNISKFQLDQESGRRRNTLWICYLQIIIYLLYLRALISDRKVKQKRSFKNSIIIHKEKTSKELNW